MVHLKRTYVVILVLLGAGAASAADYTFTEIARANTSDLVDFESILSAPSINSEGVLAFRAKDNDANDGMFTGSGDGFVTIASTASGFSSFFGAPSINASGQVAFAALRPEGLGVFRGDGTATVTIGQSSDGFFSFIGLPSINASGAVAFFSSDIISAGLFMGSGGPIMAVYRNGDYGLTYATEPALNDAGELSFVTNAGSESTGVARGSGGAPIIIGSGGYSLLSQTSLNSGGVVAYRAKTFGLPEDAIFQGSVAGGAVVVADKSGPFAGFGFEAAVSASTLVFYATLDSGENGLFISPDPATDTVIKSGDALFGETMESFPFALHRFAVNDAGQIAFAALLSNEDYVVVRADPGLDCPGDANGDGTVDPLDAGYVLARLGCPVGTGDPDCDAADQNGDGEVDPLDVGFVLARFGDCP